MQRQKSSVPGRRVVVFLSLCRGAQFLRSLNRCITNGGYEQNLRQLHEQKSCLISLMEWLQVLQFVPQDENSFILSICCSLFLDFLTVVCFEKTKETASDSRKNNRLREWGGIFELKRKSQRWHLGFIITLWPWKNDLASFPSLSFCLAIILPASPGV